MSGASRWFEGGCHCGAVRFRVRCAEPVTVYECNCSICSMCGYQHLFTGGDDFELLSGEDHLTDYRFGTGTARHRFCSTCGIKSFYVPRTHPNGISVNLRCLDPGPEAVIEPFDGRNWEQANAGL